MPTQTTTATTKPKIKERKLPFKLGADPEFLLFHGNRALNAKGLIENFLRSKTGLRAGSLGFNMAGVGQIGWDGANSTGELRPDPSDSPEGLTQNIGILIETMHKHMPFLDYTTLSIGSSIGGHLHVDIPNHLIQQPTSNPSFNNGISVFPPATSTPNNSNNSWNLPERTITTKEQQSEMNRITKLLATFVMPIIASEHRISSSGRLAGSYGKADDIHWDRQTNGQATLEIRGMSAEWITSPKTVLATVAYFAVVMNELVKHNKELILEKAILKTKGHITAVQHMMLSDYKIIEVAIVKSLYKTIQQFELYKMFKEEVDFIMHPHAVMAEKEKHGWTLTSGWNLDGKGKSPTKKDIFANRKIANKLKNADHVTIEEGFNVPYNDDYNISLFAKAITDRIATINWKLNNEYFLFGLKKGIQGYSAMKCKDNIFYIIPPKNPHENTKQSSSKMAEKFEGETRGQVRIDPKTGKTRRWGLNQVVIGIPYDPRAENNPKSLLELIWNIERNTLKPKPLNKFKKPIQKKTEETNINVEQILTDAQIRRNGNLSNTQIRIGPITLAELNEEPAT